MDSLKNITNDETSDKKLIISDVIKRLENLEKYKPGLFRYYQYGPQVESCMDKNEKGD